MLTNRLFPAVSWIFSSTLGQQFIQFASLIVLARILDPSDFGVVSASMVVVGFFAVLVELGLGPALVQKKNIDENDIGGVTALSLSLSVIVCLVLYFCADFVEDLLGLNGVSSVISVACILLPISSALAIVIAVNQRHGYFKRIALFGFFSYVSAYFVIAIPMAVMGFGVYAIVSGLVFQPLLNLMFFLLCRERSISINCRCAGVQQMVRYGFGHTLARSANYLANQVDNLIVGKVLGAEALGFYSRSYSLLVVPANTIGSVADKVLFPLFSRLQNDIGELSSIFKKSLVLIFLLSVPINAFFVVYSREFITLLLGEKWADAAAVFQALAWCMSLRVAYKITDTVARATGRVYKRALIQIVYAVLVAVFAFFGAINGGVVGVGYGVALAVLFNYIFMLALTNAVIKLKWVDLINLHLLFGLYFGFLYAVFWTIGGGSYDYFYGVNVDFVAPLVILLMVYSFLVVFWKKIINI